MGGILGKNRGAGSDSFYTPVPPPGSLSPPVGYDPTGGLGAYNPYETYSGYGYDPDPSMGNYYGRPSKPRVNPFGGRYAQGLNQVMTIAPWNYGNYYLGNTTMQMMPMMLNKVHKYGQIQAMAALGNAGLLGPGFGNAGLLGAGFNNVGSFGAGFGNASFIGSAPIMPSMPMMPCCMPSSFSMPMAAPMMAAATPLPVAFNPLVQGMYPMASMNPVSWMTPQSFMSALTSGPMPYRPPGFDFPSNVGMVMTVPYGTPNPLLLSPSFPGFNSPNSFAGSGVGGCPWKSFSDQMSAPAPTSALPAPSTVSYYPRPVNVPQPYPVPYSAPLPVPNVQPAPVPNFQPVPVPHFQPVSVQHPVSVVAPPIVASSADHKSLPVSAAVPLWPSEGIHTDGNFGRSAVMASNNNSTTNAPINNRSISGALPVYDPTDKSHLLIGQPVTSSFSIAPINNNERVGITPSRAKNSKTFSQSYDSFSTRFRRHIPSIPRFSQSNHTLSTNYSRRDPALPPILRGQLISDSGWLPKTSKLPSVRRLFSSKKTKQSSYITTNNNTKGMLYATSSGTSLIKRRHRRSSSSASEYDCAICQQERDKRRLRDHYGSSTVSSLLSSSPKGSRRDRFSPNESVLSSTPRSMRSSKQGNYKSHRRHPTKIKIKSRTPSSKHSNSPILLRKTSLREEEEEVDDQGLHEEQENLRNEQKNDDDDVEEIQKENVTPDKKSSDDSDSIRGKPDHHTSKISIQSIDE